MLPIQLSKVMINEWRKKKIFSDLFDEQTKLRGNTSHFFVLSSRFSFVKKILFLLSSTLTRAHKVLFVILLRRSLPFQKIFSSMEQKKKKKKKSDREIKDSNKWLPSRAFTIALQHPYHFYLVAFFILLFNFIFA